MEGDRLPLRLRVRETMSKEGADIMTSEGDTLTLVCESKRDDELVRKGLT